MFSTPDFWYGEQRGPVYYLSLPVSWLFCMLVSLRYFLYRKGIFRTSKASVPVVVVGNITAGGTGKTPLVIWMVNFLKQQGLRPGIVSRGYGGNASSWPQQVRADSDFVAVGDEAVMIAARTECPMAVGPERREVVASLLEHHELDVVVADDGLQHYALGRDVEVAVIDGERRFGNGQCLPAGPLRERPSRLEHADMVVVNGIGERHEHSMTTTIRFAVNMLSGETRGLDRFTGYPVHAVAGIGNPERFFSSLELMGLHIEKHSFPDHHPYTREDLPFGEDATVLMTEKDAVKCVRFAGPGFWCVPVNVEMGQAFSQRLLMLLEKSGMRKAGD